MNRYCVALIFNYASCLISIFLAIQSCHDKAWPLLITTVQIISHVQLFDDTHERGNPAYLENLACDEYRHSVFGPEVWPDVETLKSLRLTSRATCEIANRFLFSPLCITLSPFLTKDPNVFIDHCVLNSSTWPASNFRRLRIQLEGQGWNSCIFELSDDEEYERATPEDVDLRKRNASRSDRLLQRLPELLHKLPRLESFEFRLPGWASEWNGVHGWISKLDLPKLADLMQSLVNGFRAASFKVLSDLRLSLSCIYDFVQLSQVLSETRLNRLRNLLLEVTDSSGAGGSRDYLAWGNEDEDYDGDFPFTNLQQEYPNGDYSFGIFDIVATLPGLESLAIIGTHLLDGDALIWEPKPGGLKILFLQRVKVSAENLIRLLSSSSRSGLVLTILEKVWLGQVELTAGTWAEVFDHLHLCQRLLPLKVRHLAYCRDGSSAHLRVYWTNPFDVSASIWSLDHADNESWIRVIGIIDLREKTGMLAKG